MTEASTTPDPKPADTSVDAPAAGVSQAAADPAPAAPDRAAQDAADVASGAPAEALAGTAAGASTDAPTPAADQASKPTEAVAPDVHIDGADQAEEKGAGQLDGSQAGEEGRGEHPASGEEEGAQRGDATDEPPKEAGDAIEPAQDEKAGTPDANERSDGPAQPVPTPTIPNPAMPGDVFYDGPDAPPAAPDDTVYTYTPEPPPPTPPSTDPQVIALVDRMAREHDVPLKIGCTVRYFGDSEPFDAIVIGAVNRRIMHVRILSNDNECMLEPDWAIQYLDDAGHVIWSSPDLGEQQALPTEKGDGNPAQGTT